MSEEKGILTKEQEKRLANIVDDVIKVRGLGELVDGYAAKIIINVIDDSLVEKLNLLDDFKSALSELADAAMDENIGLVEAKSIELLNKFIDVPGIDEDSEAVLFEGAIKFLTGALMTWCRNR